MSIKSGLWYSVKREIKYILRDIKQEWGFAWEDICIWVKDNQQICIAICALFFAAIIITFWFARLFA